jgi:hypothetical protein
MPRIDITTTPTSEGWLCDVTVGNGDTTRHRVRVTPSDLARLAPGASDPEDLVQASFDFLLGREPRESILREFDLTVVARYYPDFEQEIKPRQAGRSARIGTRRCGTSSMATVFPGRGPMTRHTRAPPRVRGKGRAARVSGRLVRSGRSSG